MIALSDRLSGEGDLRECESCYAMAKVRLAANSGEEAVRWDRQIMAQAEVQAGFGVLIWFHSLDEVLLSEGAYAINGLTPTKTLLTADLVASIVHSDDREAVGAGLAAAAAGGEYDLRHRVVWPDGTIRWVHSKAQLVPETADHPAFVLGTNIDITDEMTP